MMSGVRTVTVGYSDPSDPSSCSNHLRVCSNVSIAINMPVKPRESTSEIQEKLDVVR